MIASTNSDEPYLEDGNAKEAESTQLAIPKSPKQVGREKAASLLDTAPWIEDGIKDGQLTSLMITQQYFASII